MKNGKCPRCGSDKIYTAENLPLKGGPFASNAIPVSLTCLAPLDNYVCTACGLVEHYVLQEEKMAEIKRKWRRVGAANESTED
ncbi:MAG: hypothetical protein HKP58_03580 [Desulfatitalea sp.]|nr:hypothetical protein [Desulfatitalea sp.]NNJ99473.1 hypothetical protein [Desulfatitalea sp.]